MSNQSFSRIRKFLRILKTIEKKCDNLNIHDCMYVYFAVFDPD